VLQQIYSNIGISRKAMLIIDSMVTDTFEKVAEEAGRLAR